MTNGIDTLPEDQDVPISGIASFLPGPSTDFPLPPTYIGPSSDEPRLDVLSEGTEAYESLPIWKQISLGVTPAGVMADIMMTAKYGRDALEEFIAENYGAAAVALTMTALVGVGYIPGVGDAASAGGKKLLRKLGKAEPKVKWRPDMPPEEKAQWFREFGESFGGHDKDPLSVSSLKEIPWEKKVELMGGYDIPSLVAPHNRTGIEKLLPQKYAQRVRDWRVDKQQGTRDRFKQEEDAYWEELWKQRDEIEIEGETLGEYVPTLDEEFDNVVDFPRSRGIEHLIHPDLLKQRRYLLEEYGIDEAGLVKLTKQMREYEAKGIPYADFSRKLTPQDLRNITGIEGGRPWWPPKGVDPDNFAYGGGVNSLYIDQGVPVNGIASFRPSV